MRLDAFVGRRGARAPAPATSRTANPLDLAAWTPAWCRPRSGGPAAVPAVCRHPVVDDPAAEVVVVDPGGNGLVVPVGNQQRQGEAVQQPLRGAFPVGLLLADRDQLTGERQRLLGQPQLAAEPLPALPGLRAGMLFLRAWRLRSSALTSAASSSSLRLRDGHLGQLVLARRRWTPGAAPRAAAICPPPDREVLGSRHRVQADLRERARRNVSRAGERASPGVSSSSVSQPLDLAPADRRHVRPVRCAGSVSPIPEARQADPRARRAWTVSRVRSVQRSDSNPSTSRSL